MLTFQNPLSETQELGRRSIGSTIGSIEVEHETYPYPITDTRTGFTVDAGPNVILHVAKRRLYRSREQLKETKSGLTTDLHLLAQRIQTWYHPDTLPKYVLGATHIAMGRLACTLGFRRILTDPRFIGVDYREHFERTIKGFQRLGINTEDNNDVHVVFMPMTDLLSVYGGDEPPTSQQIAELRHTARAESEAIESYAASSAPALSEAA